MDAVLIENPKAGGASPGSLRVAERALASTFDLELVSTTARGHAAALAREAVESGAKTVIAYGGDGTTNEIVNGMLGTASAAEVTLAVLPGGTTNVLARNLGFPNDLVEATAHLLEVVERGEPRRLDIGRIVAESEHGHIQRDFVFAAGLVLDAEIVRRVNASKRGRGVGVFLYHGLRSFFSVRKDQKARLVLRAPDGRTEEGVWACLALMDPYTYFKSRPLRVVPRLDEHPGGIDALVSKQVRFWPTLRWLSQALTTAKHVRHRDAALMEGCSELSIRADRPVHLQTDGEYIGDVTELVATRLPAALPVWA